MKKKNRFRSVLFFSVACLFLFQFAFAADGLFGWLGDLAQFIKRIFVPDPNYFHNRLQELNDLINSRFGGLGDLFLILYHFFSALKSVPSVSISLTIPDDFFFPGFQGFSANFLAGAAPYVSLLRNVFTASCILFTAIVCYHKLRHFFTEGE